MTKIIHLPASLEIIGETKRNISELRFLVQKYGLHRPNFVIDKIKAEQKKPTS